MNKSRLLIALILPLLLMICHNSSAQKGQKSLSVKAGYERYYSLSPVTKSGISSGVEFKYYLLDRLYSSSSVHIGYANAKKEITTSSAVLKGVYSKAEDYLLSLELGFDVINIKNTHKIYLQGGAGIGSLSRTSVLVDEKGGTATYYPMSKAVGVLSAQLGYDYYITERIGIGANYSLFRFNQIDDNDCFNIKFTYLFQ